MKTKESLDAQTVMVDDPEEEDKRQKAEQKNTSGKPFEEMSRRKR